VSKVSGRLAVESEEELVITPPPVGTGSGVLFSLDFFLSLFVSLFVSLSARLRENGWTDLHEIFREGVE